VELVIRDRAGEVLTRPADRDGALQASNLRLVDVDLLRRRRDLLLVVLRPSARRTNDSPHAGELRVVGVDLGLLALELLLELLVLHLVGVDLGLLGLDLRLELLVLRLQRVVRALRNAAAQKDGRQ